MPAIMSREAIAVVGMGMIVVVVVVASVLMVVEVRVWQQMGSYLQRKWEWCAATCSSEQ